MTSEENGGVQTIQKISIMRMIIISACTAAINFGFAAEFGYATPIFSELGLTPFWSSFAWLAGPISGLIAFPLSSSLSDLCTSRFGKRRPYIIFGLVLIVLGILLFINPVTISHWLGGKGKTNTTAIVIAIFAMWLFNIGLNVCMGPAWTLVIDQTPDSQQHMSSAIITLLSSVSALIAMLIGWVNFQSLIGFSSATVLFTSCLFFIIFLSLPTILGSREIPLTKEKKKELKVPKNIFVHLFKGAKNITLRNFVVLLSMGLSYAAMFPYNIFMTDYMGQVVYGGNPNADHNSAAYLQYQEGVRQGSLIGAIASAFGVLVSASVPYMMDRIGYKVTYASLTLIAVGTSIFPIFVQFRTFYWMLFVALCQGFLNSSSNIIPTALIARSVAKEDMGTYVGFMNIFQVTGQACGNFFAGFIMSHYGMSFGLASGAIFSALSLISIIFMHIPKNEEESKEKEIFDEKTPILSNVVDSSRYSSIN